MKRYMLLPEDSIELLRAQDEAEAAVCVFCERTMILFPCSKIEKVCMQRRVTEERLGQEALYLTGAADRQLVAFRQLIHAHDGDDILQLLIALEDVDDRLRNLIVLLADNVRRQDTRRRVQRIDGRVDAERSETQHDYLIRWLENKIE